MVDPDRHPVIYQLMEPASNAMPSWQPLDHGIVRSLQTFKHREPAMFSIGKSLVVAGGHSGDGSNTADRISEYCLETNSWKEPSIWPWLPEAVSGLQHVLARDQLYLLRGTTGGIAPNISIFSMLIAGGRPNQLRMLAKPLHFHCDFIFS